MQSLLELIRRYESGLYLLLAFPLVLFLLRAWHFWQQAQAALFGLEWEQARQRFLQNLLGVFLTLGMMLGVFVVASFTRPEYTRLVVPTVTATLEVPPEITRTPQVTPTPTPLPAAEPNPEACVPGQVELLEPQDGQTVRGEITIRGSASIPNFAFYKVEFAPKGTALFLTIKAGRDPVVEDVLVEAWDTGMLEPGEYLLQLVVVDTAGEARPPCRILIRVEPAPP